ncbi:MAG: GlsB/YeaQ/YmgE family stress response membrane protein [Bacteroidales bacterium]|nr:GlsB/YeaQ/YmgE family stress response membrane protein [Bacteroidales bacterium]
MILASIGISTWLVWGLIGVIGGYMAGRLIGSGQSMVVLNVVVGIIGAVIGGWVTISYFGQNDQGQTLSLVGSVIICGLLLWVLNIFVKGRDEPDED